MGAMGCNFCGGGAEVYKDKYAMSFYRWDDEEKKVKRLDCCNECMMKLIICVLEHEVYGKENKLRQ